VEAANGRDSDALEAIVSPPLERVCPATPDVQVRSFERFRRFLEQDAKTTPDNHVALQTLVAEGDSVAFWATYSGTQSEGMGPFPATGRRSRASSPVSSASSRTGTRGFGSPGTTSAS
jgi:hypothetical protein